jgi:hypothetical protein
VSAQAVAAEITTATLAPLNEEGRAMVVELLRELG